MIFVYQKFPVDFYFFLSFKLFFEREKKKKKPNKQKWMSHWAHWVGEAGMWQILGSGCPWGRG